MRNTDCLMRAHTVQKLQIASPCRQMHQGRFCFRRSSSRVLLNYIPTTSIYTSYTALYASAFGVCGSIPPKSSLA